MEEKKLTKQQQKVLTALTTAGKPQSAYTLLENLHKEGFKVPLQVYRALNALIDVGLVHKLESINAFVACAHTHSHKSGLAAFTICDNCGQADEFSDEKIESQLKNVAINKDFSLAHTIIEMRGICKSCHTH